MADPTPGGEDRVAVPAAAKINLYLHVTGKRADGYHLLDSLVAFAGIHDLIETRPASTLTLAVEGPFGDKVPGGADNLVLRAAQLLGEAYGVDQGASIRLVKRLPPASGMGGGSADAAATLKALTVLWGIDATGHELLELAEDLGADVPVCLIGEAAFMAGIGEDLAPAPALPPAWLVLVNPGVEVPTPEVFRRRSGPFSSADRFQTVPADAAALARLLASRRNDLAAAAIEIAPVIKDALAALEQSPGVLLARMTGSGATCFGLFADAKAATTATLTLGRDHPGWWVKVASLEGDTSRLHR